MKTTLAILALISAFPLINLHAADPTPPVGQGDSSAPKPGVVGILLKDQDGHILVEEILRATPASRQTAIQPGDEILSVAEENQPPVAVPGLTIAQVSALIRGSVGSKVQLSVTRPGQKDHVLRQVTITREQLRDRPFEVGDLAPKWQTGPWLKGEPVKTFEPDKVYLIECWATWCGPCVAGIPHLNELNLKYRERDLVVVGQNIWQKDEAVVRKFVESMGDKMSYRVAMDLIPADDTNMPPKGVVSEAWIQPKSGWSYGVPTAFLVGKDARIAWSGNPRDLTEAMIETALDAPKGIRDLTK